MGIISRQLLELAWLAGFLDGEGSIMFTLVRVRGGRHIVPEIQICNTHKPTIDKVSGIFKAHDVGHHIQLRVDRKSKNKTQYALRIAGMKRTIKVLDLLEPFFVTKAEQAINMRQFIEHRKSKAPNTPYGTLEMMLYARSRELNRIGASEAIRQAPNVLG